ncbi:HXXEE domain-containing protein, partial [Streptococcus agalactiae]
AFAELAMHLFFFNLSLKKWYNPGLLTTLVGLVPVSVYYLAHDCKC